MFELPQNLEMQVVIQTSGVQLKTSLISFPKQVAVCVYV